jgi:hypothetical protein
MATRMGALDMLRLLLLAMNKKLPKMIGVAPELVLPQESESGES